PRRRTVSAGITRVAHPLHILLHVHTMHCLFCFTDTPTAEAHTLSLHDALPICWCVCQFRHFREGTNRQYSILPGWPDGLHLPTRSEEHTSELQSRENLVCRLLLEKKKNRTGKRRSQSTTQRITA